jgi:hypothetical protein
MIIFLDILPEEFGGSLSGQLEVSVTRLILAYRDGQHRVIIEPETVRELLKYEWSPKVRATLQRIGNEHYSVKSLLETSGYVLCVRQEGTVRRPLKPNWQRISFSEFNSAQLHLSTVLLVENADIDGVLIEAILRIVARRNRITPLHVEIDHGGGEGIVTAFAQNIAQGRFPVCVIDSDKDTPFCASPVKETKLRNCQGKSGWQFAKIVVLKCREIENLLDPDRIISLRCAVEYRHKNHIYAIVKTEKDIFGHDSLWMYFDIKNGIRRKVIERLDGTRQSWIISKMQSIGLKYDGEISGFGERVISCFLDEKTFFDSLSELVNKHSSWGPAFRPTFDMLAWYFIGGPRLVT